MSEFLIVVVKFIYYIAFFGTLINLSLIAFNLLPLYPLDGFRVIEALTPPNNKFVVFMRRYSLYIFLGLILLGVIPQIDVLGMYINAVRVAILKLFSLIFGVNI
jgi:Zn-dependent protease